MVCGCDTAGGWLIFLTAFSSVITTTTMSDSSSNHFESSQNLFSSPILMRSQNPLTSTKRKWNCHVTFSGRLPRPGMLVPCPGGLFYLPSLSNVVKTIWRCYKSYSTLLVNRSGCSGCSGELAKPRVSPG